MDHNKTPRIRVVQRFALVTVLSMLVAAGGRAATIEYSTTSLGGSNYRIEYTITNDQAAPLALIDILFDPAKYDESSISIATPALLATSWDEVILASSPAQPFAYDIFSLSSGIASGASESGFAVEVLWLGSGAPASQMFEVYDPNTFDLVSSGVSVAATVVPLPLPFLLLAVPSALLARMTRQRRLS